MRLFLVLLQPFVFIFCLISTSVFAGHGKRVKQKGSSGKVKMETNYGDIILELNQEKTRNYSK